MIPNFHSQGHTFQNDSLSMFFSSSNLQIRLDNSSTQLKRSSSSSHCSITITATYRREYGCPECNFSSATHKLNISAEQWTHKQTRKKEVTLYSVISSRVTILVSHMCDRKLKTWSTIVSYLIIYWHKWIKAVTATKTSLCVWRRCNRRGSRREMVFRNAVDRCWINGNDWVIKLLSRLVRIYYYNDPLNKHILFGRCSCCCCWWFCSVLFRTGLLSIGDCFHFNFDSMFVAFGKVFLTIQLLLEWESWRGTFFISFVRRRNTKVY